ncbi:MAG: leucine-rich repeat protein, partial [Christensenella sp.]|nr:leucine-rich repeat protein [Christensenella sp.]
MTRLKTNILLFLFIIIGFSCINISQKVYAEENCNIIIQNEKDEINVIIHRLNWEDYLSIYNSINYIIEDESISFECKKNMYVECRTEYLRNQRRDSNYNAKSYYDDFNDLTQEEQDLALQHPIAAIKVNECKNYAISKAQEYYTSNGWRNSHDAFRHACWNAMMVKEIGFDLAKAFADAHETEPDSTDPLYELDLEMDLYNNIGRDLALNFGSLSQEDLAKKIMNKVSFGHMKIFSETNELTESNMDGLKTEVAYETADIDSDKIKITRVKLEVEGSFAIPSNLNDRIVCSLGDYAFQNQSQVTMITLPNTIESIGEYCFYNCTNITSIFAQNTKITQIEEGVFYAGSDYLVYLPNGITYVGDYSLATTRPAKLNLSTFDTSSLTYIGQSAFYNCYLNGFEFSNSLTHIGLSAFQSSNLNGTIYLSENIQEIEAWAFYDTDVSTIYIEKSQTASGLESSWNAGIPTIYNCTFTSDKASVLSVNKSSSSLQNVNTAGLISNPTRSGYSFDGWYTSSDYSGTSYTDLYSAPNGTLYAKWNVNSSSGSCISEGTQITLADGTTKRVEELTGNETLLVWDMFNGCYSTAPILFIDSEELNTYNVINLTFSDGTIVKVISDHGFFDATLNKYVYITEESYLDYIGHYFNKGNTNLQLISANIEEEYIRVYSPVTYGHLCYYVNGMLSMPGNTEIFTNIFDIDANTMRYINIEEDINIYGLYTYEEFNEIIELPEEVFNAFNGQYLK